MNNLTEEKRREIVIEEKTRLARAVRKLRSREIELVLNEESALYLRRGILRTLFEIMIGVYVGVFSIIVVVFISNLFD